MSSEAARHHFERKLEELFDVIRAHCSAPDNADALADIPAYLQALVAQNPPPTPPLQERKVERLLKVILEHCRSEENVDFLGDVPKSMAKMMESGIKDARSSLGKAKTERGAVKLDVPGYPHILQNITRFADRQTLTSLARVSSLAHSFAIPILYPGRLVDPIDVIPYPSTLPAFYFEESECDAGMSVGRFERKLYSFLRSTHMDRVQEIVISDPWTWAAHFKVYEEDCQEPMGNAPMTRGPGTTTTIRFAPSKVGQMGLRWSEVGGITTKGDKRKSKNKKKKVTGAGGEVGQSGSASGEDVERDRRCSTLTSYEVTRSILRIATLIPSEHLVVCIPASTGADLSDMVTHLLLSFQAPEGTRKLTVVWGSGNIFGHRGMTPRTKTSWDTVKVILVPGPSGVWDYEEYLPQRNNPDMPADERLVRLQPVLSLPTLPLGPKASFSIVGLENMVDALSNLPLYKQGLERMAQMHNQLMTSRHDEGRARFDFPTLKSWKKAARMGAVLDWVN